MAHVSIVCCHISFQIGKHENYLPALKQKGSVHRAKPHDAVARLEVAKPEFSQVIFFIPVALKCKSYFYSELVLQEFELGFSGGEVLEAPVAALVEEVAEAFEELAS